MNCMFAHAFITYLLWWYLKTFNIIIIYLIICEKIYEKRINLHRMFEYEDQLGHMHRRMVIWKIFLQINFELIFSITWSHKWLMKSAAVIHFMCELCRWNFCRRCTSQSMTSIWNILIISLALISWMTSVKLFYSFKKKYCSF